jgi:hypothetical protein
LALLLDNHLLSSGQLKGCPFGGAPYTALQKEVLAIAPADFLPAKRGWLSQKGSDPLLGQYTALGQCLGIAAVTVIFGVSTKPGSNRVKLDIGPHRRHRLAPFEQNTLEALGPQYPVALMAPVVPLGKLTLELFKKLDRSYILRR